MKAKRNLWEFAFCLACCCGLCVPNMLITKANAKENLGELMCLSKAKARKNPQIFICKHSVLMVYIYTAPSVQESWGDAIIISDCLRMGRGGGLESVGNMSDIHRTCSSPTRDLPETFYGEGLARFPQKHCESHRRTN